MLERVDADLRDALRAGNAVTVSVLRMLKSELHNAAKEAGQLSDDAAIAVVRRELKKRTEAAAAFAKAGHTDRSEGETAEAAVLRGYLPPMADDAAILGFAQGVHNLPEGMAAKGMLIKAIKEQFGSSVDGTVAARIADEVLASR